MKRDRKTRAFRSRLGIHIQFQPEDGGRATPPAGTQLSRCDVNGALATPAALGELTVGVGRFGVCPLSTMPWTGSPDDTRASRPR